MVTCALEIGVHVCHKIVKLRLKTDIMWYNRGTSPSKTCICVRGGYPDDTNRVLQAV